MEANWKQRLEHWAPAPPPGVWEQLAAALSEEQPPAFAQRLQQFSTPPPTTAWAQISRQLEPGQQTALVVRMLSRRTALRYGMAAASVLVAVLLLRSFNFSNDTPQTRHHLINRQSVWPLPAPALQSFSPVKKEQSATGRSPRAAAPEPAWVPVPRMEQTPVYTASPLPASGLADLHHTAPATVLPKVLADRYIVVPLDEEKAVRLPRQLYDQFRCAEDPTPATACGTQLQQARQLSAAPALLVPCDFGGLLELVQQVNSSR